MEHRDEDKHSLQSLSSLVACYVDDKIIFDWGHEGIYDARFRRDDRLGASGRWIRSEGWVSRARIRISEGPITSIPPSGD